MRNDMRAVIAHDYGKPESFSLEERPTPEPGPGEILVRVSACGVCHTDLHVMKAEVAFPTPAVMGHEISGTVAALGPGVAGPPVGTKVVSAFIMPCGFCAPCGAGRDAGRGVALVLPH
jgi:S-(hydroxymethyl)glutathione dehydrogenase/alcohol dehydrogenase